MKTTRRARRTVRTVGLVAAAAAATFSLTACQDGGGKDDDAGSYWNTTPESAMQ